MERPRVILHASMSLDGRIDGFPVDVGLHYRLAARLRPDVHLTGSETILGGLSSSDDADVSDPLPTFPAAGRPLLVVPDSRGRIVTWRALRAAPFWRGAVALCTTSTPSAYLRSLDSAGVDVLLAGVDRVDLPRALHGLAQRYGARRVLLDGGPTLNGLMLAAGLVDELSLLLHPCLAAVDPARAPIRLNFPLTGLSPIAVEAEGAALWLRYDVSPGDPLG
jgi:2,5-diamino-6-(ribosylamino)-4(3H)-pyrimidinone 5'-phosphate reductase